MRLAPAAITQPARIPAARLETRIVFSHVAVFIHNFMTYHSEPLTLSHAPKMPAYGILFIGVHRRVSAVPFGCDWEDITSPPLP
jgi:hypothetical protein